MAVLRKHPQLRTEEDLQLLAGPVEALKAALLPQGDDGPQCTPGDLRELAMSLRHEVHPAGQALFDYGNYFFRYCL